MVSKYAQYQDCQHSDDVRVMVNRKSIHSHSQMICRLLISHCFPLCDAVFVRLLISHRFLLCDMVVCCPLADFSSFSPLWHGCLLSACWFLIVFSFVTWLLSACWFLIVFPFVTWVFVVRLLISHRFPLCDVGVVRLHGAKVCLLVLCSEGERTGSNDVRPTTSASRLVSQCLIVWCDKYYLYLNVSKTKDVCWHWEW